MITIKHIFSKQEWEKFLYEHASTYPFFQSWNWGEVQEKLGFEVLRFGIFDNKTLIGVCMVIVINAKRGRYLHLRHGPIFSRYSKEYVDCFIDYLSAIGKDKHAFFIRMSPLLAVGSVSEISDKKWKNAPIHNMDGEICWVLDITKSEDDLLKNMRKSHRYLIRKAPSYGIEIFKTEDQKYISEFLEIYKDLSKRKHFVPHKGIAEEFAVLTKDKQVLLFLAKYEKKLIAGALILFVGDMAIYHHSSSLDAYKHIPASYLIQWEAIKEAKKRGKQLYNFWGIAPTAAKNHPWQGLTLFKTGFGGYKREFLHAQDLPLSTWYYKTFFIEYIAKMRKGY